MNIGRWAAHASLVSVALMLSACGGGGGVASTPAPTPAPGPAPSPSPSPTPTATNDDLLLPLVTESFSNKAAVGTGSFPTNGDPGTRTAAAATITVRYDAATNSYTVTDGARSQTFRPGDVFSQDATQIDYQRTSGSTTDSLVLTKPGTSGALTYKYVGSGFWQRTVTGTATVDASIDAFVYGVKTPDAAVPTSGSGSYSVDLIGTQGLTDYAGNGNLSVDFGSGDLLIDIDVHEILEDGTIPPGSQKFRGNGTLASTNAFTGHFTLPFFEQYSGTFNGQFFGPSVDEVGAAFYGTGTQPGSAIVGTFMGRTGGSASNTSFANLAVDQDFDVPVSDIFLAEAISDGHARDYFAPSQYNLTLSYDAAAQSFHYADAFYGRDVTFLPSMRSVSADGKFIVYDAGDGQSLTLYRPGPNNPELQLTYASFGIYGRTFDEAAFDRRGHGFDYFPIGVLTAAMPSTGSATYSGRLYGQGVGDAAFYDLTGTAAFNVSFLNAGLTGSLAVTGTERQLGGAVDFGSLPFSGTFDRSTAHWSATADNGFGWLTGGFYGPNAAEIAAMFGGFRATDPAHPGVTVNLGGALAGKKN